MYSLFGIRRVLRRGLGVDDGAGQAVEVAAVPFLDLELAGPHPEAVAGAVRRHGVVAAAAVADLVLARRPALLAPLELEPQMVVLERGAGRQRAIDLAGDPDGLAAVDRDDREHRAWIGVDADTIHVLAFRVARPGQIDRGVGLAQERLPAGQIPAVEQTRPCRPWQAAADASACERRADSGRTAARAVLPGGQTRATCDVRRATVPRATCYVATGFVVTFSRLRSKNSTSFCR